MFFNNPLFTLHLQLYTSLPTHKLASFMDVSEGEYDSFLGKLLSFKVGLPFGWFGGIPRGEGEGCVVCYM